MLDFHLPIDSHLLLAGYKKVSFNYRRRIYLNRPELTEEDEFTVKQELKVRARGIMARKFYLDVDYDDTRSDTSQDIIALYYRGDVDEIITEVGMGDLKLELPATEFVVFNKNVFGAKFHLVFDATKSFAGKKENNQPIYKLPKRGNFTSSPAADPRFTLSNSPLLLNPPAPVYPNLELTVIASRTKGISVEKEFSGKTLEKTVILHDVDYLLRRYFRVFQNSSELPITSTSEAVYLDDRNGYNNDNTVKRPTWPQFDFDKLKSGHDYFINYQTGVLTLRRPLDKNMALAIEFDNGTNYLLKDEDSFSAFELRNRYFLGAYNIDPDEVTLRITDKKGTDLNLETYRHEIDFEAGILTFAVANPFSLPDYPHVEDWQFALIVRFEEALRVYVLHPSVISGSEIVTIDDNRLERDKDYLIDYESGILTFLKPVKIDAESEIIVHYEYLPFGGKFKKTLLGAQVGFNWRENNNLRFTFMQEKSDLLESTPHLNATPDQTRVIDVAAAASFESEMLNFSLEGEWSESSFEANIMDRVFIDSFEEGLQSFDLDLVKEKWQISSPPLGAGGNRQNYQLADSSEDHDDDDSEGSLEISYQLIQLNSWIAVNTLLDAEGIDVSEKSYVELWVYGDGSGTSLNLDLGQINEDTDSDGILDSEDSNEDGRLNSGEDNGFLFNESGFGSDTIGSNNGRLDTEDLDGDGNLDVTNENYLQLSASINWVGWKKVVLYFDDASLVPAPPVDRLNVKTLRLWLEGNGSGVIRIESIRIVGHSWEIGREDDVNTPELDGSVSDKFLVDEGELNSGDFYSEENEHSLKLQFDLASGEAGYTRLNYARPKDFSDYREFNFDVRTFQAATIFLRLLTSENDYYFWQGAVDASTFREISLALEDDNENKVPDGFSRVGKANLQSINSVAIGVINTGTSDITSTIYLDNLHLRGSDPKKAVAHKVAFELKWPRLWALQGKKITKEVDFHTIGSEKIDQTETTYRLATQLTALKFSPIYGFWEYEIYDELPNPYAAIANKHLKGRTNNEKRLAGQLILATQPQLLSWQVDQNRRREISYGSDRTETSLRLDSHLLAPTSLARYLELITQYRFNETIDEYSRTTVYEKDQRIIEREGAAEIEYRPINGLRIHPGYSKMNSTLTRHETRPHEERIRSFVNASYYSGMGIDPRGHWQEYFNEFFLHNFKKEARLEKNYGLGVRLTPSKWLELNPFYLDLDYKHHERGRFLNVSEKTFSGFVALMQKENQLTGKSQEGLKTDQLVNYRRLDNYQSTAQWEIVDYLKLLSDFGFSYERERNEGSVNLIERSVLKNSFNWNVKKMTPFLPLYGLNLLPSYGVVNKHVVEEKRNLDINQKLEAIFKWSVNFHTATSYEHTQNEETPFTEGSETRTLVRRVPAQSLFYRWKDAFVLRIPFTKKRFKLTNRLELNSRYQRTEVRAANLPQTDEINRDDYSLNFKYYFTHLITLTLGGDWTEYENLSLSGEDYSEQSLKADIEALF